MEEKRKHTSWMGVTQNNHSRWQEFLYTCHYASFGHQPSPIPPSVTLHLLGFPAHSTLHAFANTKASTWNAYPTQPHASFKVNPRLLSAWNHCVIRPFTSQVSI
jgi:hypothetical protein